MSMELLLIYRNIVIIYYNTEEPKQQFNVCC